MKSRTTFTVVAVLCALGGCAQEKEKHSEFEDQMPELPEHVSRKAEAVVGELGRSEYDELYARLSQPLAALWSKETFVANMGEIRKAVGEQWRCSPSHRALSVGLLGKKYSFSFNLTDVWVSDYQFSFPLVGKEAGWEIVELEARMPYAPDTPVGIEVQKTCERFLSLMVEGKTREARKMLGEPANRLLAWTMLKKAGRIYKELRDGKGVSYELHRVFAMGRCVERAHVTEKGSEVSRFHLDLEKTEKEGFLVKGFAY